MGGYVKMVHEQIRLVVHVPVLLSQVATFWWSDVRASKERASSKRNKFRILEATRELQNSPCQVPEWKVGRIKLRDTYNPPHNDLDGYGEGVDPEAIIIYIF